jgi:aryl-alcohol dehydrogenase-like predicted oxidoreductase
MQTRQLGKTGVKSFPLGLGCMGMSDFYGPSDRQEALATIRMALDAEINLLDTGDFYGMGHNELLLREALAHVPREQVLISVKFGALRGPDNSWLGFDARPAAVKTFVTYSLRRLGVDYIDIYRPARLDPTVPIEDTVGAVADLVKSGYVRHIGLSEMSADTIRRAHAVHPIADLQIEYSLISRGIEDKILSACRELGIGITAYGVLSRGLISGHWDKAKDFDKGDFRSFSPRFQQGNIDQNLSLVDALQVIAKAKHVSVAQIAIAWVLSRDPLIVPLIGARRRERLSEALGALEFNLTEADLAAIEQAVPRNAAAGARYPEHGMASLDSER